MHTVSRVSRYYIHTFTDVRARTRTAHISYKRRRDQQSRADCCPDRLQRVVLYAAARRKRIGTPQDPAMQSPFAIKLLPQKQASLDVSVEAGSPHPLHPSPSPHSCQWTELNSDLNSPETLFPPANATRSRERYFATIHGDVVRAAREDEIILLVHCEIYLMWFRIQKQMFI